jgi:hypothetical protein
VDYVETTLPSLINKAFRTLSKLTNNTKIFRVARLIAVLAEWFAHVLSRENAVIKSVGCLLRETELCARILQHHWRGVLFERTVNQRDYDPIVRTRLRSMHMIKFVELRHQFKVFREAVGPGGIPSSVTQAYITILYHLAKLQRDANSISDKTPSTVISDQRRILGSGVIVYVASLITRHQSRELIELVKGIVVEIVEGHGDEQLVEILQCNVVQRVQLDLACTMERSENSNVAATSAALTSSIRLLSSIAKKILFSTERWGCLAVTPSTPSNQSPSRRRTPSPVKDHNHSATREEYSFLMKRLKSSVRQFVLTADVFDTLFEALSFCHGKFDMLRAQLLDILCLLSRSLGFTQLLDALTRGGGRWLEQVLTCMNDNNLVVVHAAVTLFFEMTSRTDARHGLTTAGAVQIFMRWCRPSFEASESRMAFVMGLIGCALLARQSDKVKPSTSLLAALTTFEDRVDAMYTLLLDLALADDDVSPRAAEKTGVYLFSVNALPTVVKFLTQVSPSCMESPVQNSRQRNISCILLGRLCKVSHVTRACFSEDLVNHLALSIQCNRLDEIEGLVVRSSPEDRFVNQLGSTEACRALSRLARCPSNMVEARLRPSITSPQVPEWPQAMICDVMFRMHALEDLIALIQTPSDAAEYADVERGKVIAAVELAGYIRPLPYGESARDKFLKSHANHPQGKFAQEKLLQLVKLVAPAILHILREKSAGFDLVSASCVALSRLACTNAACSLLLTQGCLQTALIHLPEILLATGTGKLPPKRQSVEFDSSVDDHGLLDVPAALYTLFGKLCAVADGRTGIMRAQVLPRLLKRMQLRHPSSRAIDDECKSAIAVVISRLAMVNAVEGSTSELFLHFRVLELLAKDLQQHREILLTQNAGSAPGNRKDQVKRWRLLVHALGAIAALSQDVLVCVPRVVTLGIVELLFPFLAKLRSANPHLESLQYDSVTIIRSIASYPFGEYHAYLTSVKGAELERAPGDEKKRGNKDTKAMPTASSTTVMERVKQIGYDFAMELQNKPMALRDKKSVGELARETMAFINEHQQRQERQLEQRPKSSDKDTSGLTVEHPSRSSMAASPKHTKESPTRSSFPALPQSPVGRLDEITRLRPAPVPRKAAETKKDAKTNVAPSILVLDGCSKSPVSLNGVSIASTRPAGNNRPRPSSESPHAQHHYVFTRPKSKTKRRDQDLAYSLMLDPLFDSGSKSVKRASSDKEKASEDLQHLSEGEPVAHSYSFSQEVDRSGHYVNVKARRSRKGDRYFPSLGRIVTSDAAL